VSQNLAAGLIFVKNWIGSFRLVGHENGHNTVAGSLIAMGSARIRGKTMTIRTLKACMLAIILAVTLILFSHSVDAEPFGLFPAFGNNSFNEPVAVRHAGDSSGRIFVVERPGTIQVLDISGHLGDAPFLDISEQVDSTGEGGLTGLAFHPEYAANGRIYVKYTINANPGGQVQLVTRISEFVIHASDSDKVNADSKRLVLEIPQDFNNNNGGDLHFGSDGHLYVAMGDGGSGNDPCDRSQTINPQELSDCGNHPTGPAKAMLGKLLRIDVDNETEAGSNNLCGADDDGAAGYAIPTDNPYFEHADHCAEIWALGLRQPWRFSFDRLTGDLWLGDQGQNTWEEINKIPHSSSGSFNFGWRVCEGDYERDSLTTACPLQSHVSPLVSYRTDAGEPTNRGVVGGYRYRGPIDLLYGNYVYGDQDSGRIWLASTSDEQNWQIQQFTITPSGLTGFGEDEDGNIYTIHANGELRTFRPYRILRDRFEANEF
jgi:glucose/arabinose dehydrogenase